MALDNFKKIYDEELFHYESDITWEILNLTEIRAFVYEVCKKCCGEKERMDKELIKEALSTCITAIEQLHPILEPTEPCIAWEGRFLAKKALAELKDMEKKCETN